MRCEFYAEGESCLSAFGGNSHWFLFELLIFVPKGRVELPLPCENYDLNVARLPISPLRLTRLLLSSRGSSSDRGDPVENKLSSLVAPRNDS